MPALGENLRYRTCMGQYGKCRNKMYYEKSSLGWVANEDTCHFEIFRDWKVNLVCNECGWRTETSINPKNVADADSVERSE